MTKAFLNIAKRRALAPVMALAIIVSFCGSAAYAQQPKEADRVHFLLAIDTLTPGTVKPAPGQKSDLGLDLDRETMKKIIGDAANALGFKEGSQGRFTVTVLDGAAMTEKNVLDHYRTLRVGNNDTLVFYYTGHGGFDPEKGHLLAMRNVYNLGGGRQSVKYASVDRKELLAAMARHNPRAIIVLTDCCASLKPSERVAIPGRIIPPEKAFKAKLKGQGKGEVFRDLFFRTHGIVNITAARTLTPGYGDRKKGGSFFTLAMAELLRESPPFFEANAEQVVEWSGFFPRLITLTQLDSGSIMQTPEAFLLGEPIHKAKGAVVPAGGKTPVLEKEASLTRNDPTFKKGNKSYFIKNYRMKMEKDRGYLVPLHSSQFDTFLFIKNTNGKTLAFNDDYGTTTTRSRILFFPPETGAYDVGVTSYGSEETGDFSLTIQESTYADMLAQRDSLDTYCLGSFARRHPVQLKALRSYTIRLESEDTDKYDPFLRVVDEFGNTVALNDDEDEAQGRLNSVVTFRTVSAGTYFIVASSFASGQTGRYGIFIQD